MKETMNTQASTQANNPVETTDEAKKTYYLQQIGNIQAVYDQVNVRLPIELNDWLNTIVRQTKRLHGSKIPKESLIEVALLYMRSLDLEWTEIKSKEDLIETLLGNSHKH